MCLVCQCFPNYLLRRTGRFFFSVPGTDAVFKTYFLQSKKSDFNFSYGIYFESTSKHKIVSDHIILGQTSFCHIIVSKLKPNLSNGKGEPASYLLAYQSVAPWRTVPHVTVGFK